VSIVSRVSVEQLAELLRRSLLLRGENVGVIASVMLASLCPTRSATTFAGIPAANSNDTHV
jgi:hypothetical protein